MNDLPPIGAKVRVSNGVGEVKRHIDWSLTGTPMARVAWPAGGGAWVTADEIEEVLSDVR